MKVQTMNKQATRVWSKIQTLCKELESLGIAYNLRQVVYTEDSGIESGSISLGIDCVSRYDTGVVYPSGVFFSFCGSATEGVKVFSVLRDNRPNVPQNLQYIDDKPHASLARLKDIAYNECDKLIV